MNIDYTLIELKTLKIFNSKEHFSISISFTHLHTFLKKFYPHAVNLD